MPRNDNPGSSATASAFLRLPLTIRERIYALTDLVRSCHIKIEQEHRRRSDIKANYDQFLRDSYGRGATDLSERTLINWQRGRCIYDIPPKWHNARPLGAGCLHPNLPVQLLRVSKQVYSEAIRILYSQNRFVLETNLTCLPSIGLQFLTFLEVRLTTCSCITDHVCASIQPPEACKLCHFYCKRGLGPPLNIDYHRQLVAQWYAFCLRLRERLLARPTKNFQLALICDCENVDTALYIIQPLNKFPILQHATIRLGQSNDKTLGELAESTVQRLTGNTGLLSTFTSFLKLPIEIQALILTKTDLVAPLPVSWHEMMQFPDEHRQFDIGSPLRGFRLYHNKLQLCCQRCTLSGDVCACPGRHAAYTSRICQCWEFPQSLFLVSRSINKLATRIFLSQNQIVLWNWSGYLSEPIQFLKNMPLHWAEHIQWLRLSFCFFRVDYSEVGSRDHGSWVDLTTRIKQLPFTERLTLEIDYFYEIYWEWIPADLNTRGASQTYTDIIHLFRLDGSRRYKNFFVRLACWAETEEQDQRRWELERQLERDIMGETYDSAAAGKYADKLRWNESLGPKFLQAEGRWDDESLFVP